MIQAPIGIGLVGCGSIASSVHLPALAADPDANVVFVADPSPAARRRAEQIAGVRTLERTDELLASDEIQAVVVCASSNRHADLAVAAAEAGKHLYLEKPMATEADGAERALAAVRSAGITAAIGFNYRFHPGLRRGFELLAAGEIGALHAVSTCSSEPMPPWRTPDWKRTRATGGGALLDLGSHHFDLLRWLLGEELDVVEATIRSRATEQDDARVSLRTASGVLCESRFSYRSGRADILELFGERGTLRFDRYGSGLSVVSGRSRPRRLRTALAARARALRPRPDPSHRLALRAFVARLHGAERQLPTLEDGLRSLEAVLAAERLGGASGASHPDNL